MRHRVAEERNAPNRWMEGCISVLPNLEETLKQQLKVCELSLVRVGVVTVLSQLDIIFVF